MAKNVEKRSGAYRGKVRVSGFKPLSATFDTEAEAERWVKETTQALKNSQGKINVDESERVTLKEALTRYLNEVTPSKAGAKAEKNRIAALCNHPLASWNLAEIGSMQIAQLRDEMKNKGLAPSTIKNNIRPISNVYRIAATEWGMYALKNPCAGVRMPQDNPHRERRLSQNEIGRISDKLASPYKEAFLFAIETALRRGELCKLMREDVNLRKSQLRVRMPKNKNDRFVPLTQEAMQIIASLPARIDGRVFGISADSLTHAVTAAVRESGVKHATLHDARHTAVSEWVENGNLSDAQIMKISGHTTLKAFKIYVQVDAEKLAQLMAGKP